MSAGLIYTLHNLLQGLIGATPPSDEPSVLVLVAFVDGGRVRLLRHSEFLLRRCSDLQLPLALAVFSPIPISERDGNVNSPSCCGARHLSFLAHSHHGRVANSASELPSRSWSASHITAQAASMSLSVKSTHSVDCLREGTLTVRGKYQSKARNMS